MAAAGVCRYAKFGFCKHGEKCRNIHFQEICEKESCDNILNCHKRHPAMCKYFTEYGRCKFYPCA